MLDNLTPDDMQVLMETEDEVREQMYRVLGRYMYIRTYTFIDDNVLRNMILQWNLY